MVALAVLIVSVAVWITRNKRQQQQLKRRPSKVPLTRFNSGSFKSSGLGSPLTPSPPAVAAAAMWCSFLAAPENALKFPRSQLHLEMEIGTYVRTVRLLSKSGMPLGGKTDRQTNMS